MFLTALVYTGEEAAFGLAMRRWIWYNRRMEKP
jgi:hypothetical protein